ncbi:hypothetical protein [Demequina silvatica]|uniref:hypothetical protein n=1 Tax=Demequina silvatica TaxID=1638988 RepID=UPI000782DDBF|nr:hypothetical protein [Demequina silvatica]
MARESAPEPTGPEEPAGASSLPPEAPRQEPPSVLERVRRNRVGALAAGLGVAVVVALLLAILVPGEPNLYASALLGLLVTAAVGFTVRYLAVDRGWAGQGAAFLATVIGVHLMGVTGTLNGLGSGRGAGRGMMAQLGFSGIGFDDALLAALATPAVSTGGVLAGLVAAVIVGWGPRDRDRG